MVKIAALIIVAFSFALVVGSKVAAMFAAIQLPM